MKVNAIKTLLSVGISILLGIICYDIANDVDHRNIVSLATTIVTDFVCLLFAVGIDYFHGNRNVNIKVAAWLFLLIVVIANVVFSFYIYDILIYVSAVSLLVLMDIALVYALNRNSTKE